MGDVVYGAWETMGNVVYGAVQTCMVHGRRSVWYGTCGRRVFVLGRRVFAWET